MAGETLPPTDPVFLEGAPVPRGVSLLGESEPAETGTPRLSGALSPYLQKDASCLCTRSLQTLPVVREKVPMSVTVPGPTLCPRPEGRGGSYKRAHLVSLAVGETRPPCTNRTEAALV